MAKFVTFYTIAVFYISFDCRKDISWIYASDEDNIRMKIIGCRDLDGDVMTFEMVLEKPFNVAQFDQVLDILFVKHECVNSVINQTFYVGFRPHTTGIPRHSVKRIS
jgi:hypothetical protein